MESKIETTLTENHMNKTWNALGVLLSFSAVPPSVGS